MITAKALFVVAIAAYLGSLLGYRAGGKRMDKDLAAAAATCPEDLAALERIVERAMARAGVP